MQFNLCEVPAAPAEQWLIYVYFGHSSYQVPGSIIISLDSSIIIISLDSSIIILITLVIISISVIISVIISLIIAIILFLLNAF